MKSKRVTKKSSVKNRFSVITAIMLVVLIAYSAILLGLILWAVLTSFKIQDDFLLNTWKLPTTWYWNFTAVFHFSVGVASDTGTRNVGIPEMFGNSLVYALGCSFVKTGVTCITAYLCTKFKYTFSKIVKNVVIVCMIIPVIGSLPAEISMARTFGLYDHIWGVWLMQANFLGMYFLVFCSAFEAQPDSYAEAAKIDGANNYAVLFRIALPLVKNVFGTIFLITFITYWNDYQTPLVYLPSYPTAAYGMLRLSKTIDNFYSSTPMIISGAVVLMVPVLVLFLCFHKRLLGNINIGGIKG